MIILSINFIMGYTFLHNPDISLFPSMLFKIYWLVQSPFPLKLQHISVTLCSQHINPCSSSLTHSKTLHTFSSTLKSELKKKMAVIVGR